MPDTPRRPDARDSSVARRPPVRRGPITAAVALALALGVTACGGTGAGADADAGAGAGSDGAGRSPAAASDGPSEVTVRNCGRTLSFPRPAKRLFVNDSNMVSMALAIGAGPQIAAVSSTMRNAEALREHYGAAAVDRLHEVSETSPSRETVLAQRPDVMVAGWGYGWDEGRRLTPDGLAKQGIAGYTLTESCRQRGGGARGTVDPWTALRTDLRNLGAITGHEREAATVVADVDRRLTALRSAPQAPKRPTVFLFDSGTNAVFSSGRYGGPQAILDAAGARNALEDLPDTWTEVSWERVIASKPDAFLFVDYPPQTFEDKVRVLRARAGMKDLLAVREGRFLNLPYAMWTSGPLNIDAAERARKALEGWGLVPHATRD